MWSKEQQFGSSTIVYRSDSVAEYNNNDNDEYDDENDDKDKDKDYEGSKHSSNTQKELFNFGNSLTVKEGILTLANDPLKNDRKKFLEMMEQLAERRMQKEEEAANEQRDYEEVDNEYEDNYEKDGEEDTQRNNIWNKADKCSRYLQHKCLNKETKCLPRKSLYSIMAK
ncbi:salt tolerance down-regulator-domain-containing protein [Gigaspora margarita]|uniref:Salt tolerance down-regulator-domain-containing protein n=1 Tax=Gigaspora margarita TaxID=4874 RepID=A0A8H3XGT8_GIGMA|nr:salt tolerance down-regulator-domain-containing protein [Gigaspora margarita]